MNTSILFATEKWGFEKIRVNLQKGLLLYFSWMEILRNVFSNIKLTVIDAEHHQALEFCDTLRTNGFQFYLTIEAV